MTTSHHVISCVATTPSEDVRTHNGVINPLFVPRIRETLTFFSPNSVSHA